MSTRRDPDLLVHDFLMEGQTELADQVLDAVRATIEQKRQRVVIGPWRMPNMNKLVPIGIGAAAVVVALVGGTQLLRPPASGGVGGAPSATPEPSVAAPSPTPKPSAVPTRSPEGLLPEGSHVLWKTPAMTVTIPAPDWYGDAGGGILVKDNSADAPGGAGLIVFGGQTDLFVYGDPCKWRTTTPKEPVTTVDELVAALAAQKSRDASAPVDVTVGGHAGKSITLHVPDDAVFADCDAGYFGSWRVDTERTPSRYHQDPGQIDKLWIVDVGGEIVIIDIAYYEGTPQADIDELEAIVGSFAFE